MNNKIIAGLIFILIFGSLNSFGESAEDELQVLKNKLTTLATDLEIKDLYGRIEAKNQNIRLMDLRLKTLAADMAMSVQYAARSKTDASIDFDFGLTDIDIKKLVNLMPALDTLFPMANSFERDVNFKMQGRSQLDAKMGVDLPTFQAIARIEGQDLV